MWIGSGRDVICRCFRFMIFDFCKNFEWHDEFPLGKPVKHTEAIPTKIFLNRLKLYREFSSRNDNENMEKIKQKCLSRIFSK